MVSSTRLRGSYAIRLCVLNHTSGEADVRGVLDWLERAEIDADVAASRTGRPAEPEADLRPGPGGRMGHGARIRWQRSREVPLFGGLSAEQADALARDSRIRSRRRRRAGDHPLERRARFLRHPRGPGARSSSTMRSSELGPGDFFGELAALDWGAGYGYVRTATVRRSSRCSCSWCRPRG